MSDARAKSSGPRSSPSQAISSPDRVAWSTGNRDALADWLDRTSDATRQLATRFVELSLAVRESTSRPGAFGGSAPPGAFARAPLRLDVLDVLGEIDRAATDIDRTARRILSLAENRPAPARRATVERLAWLAGVIPSLWDSEPSTVHLAAQRVWALHARSGRMLGLVSSAFRIDDPCPSCHQSSLWVDPDSWSVACGLARCGHTELIEARPVRWSS